MVKKLILHIGTEKTGTTTLQHFFQDNKDELSNQGVYIPQSLGAITGKYRGNHRKLATCFMANDNIDDFKKVNNLVIEDKFSRWKSHQTKIFDEEFSSIELPLTIITSEHFSSRLTSDAEIKELSLFLHGYFDEIQVLVYLRRQVEAAVSAYSTTLKSGYNQKLILSNRPEILNNYDYYELCKRWKSNFDDVKVRVFEREQLVSGDICDDFIAYLNIKPIKLIKNKTKNPSINLLGQRFLIAWNEIEPKYKNGILNGKHEDVVSYLEEYCGGTGRLPIRSWCEEWMENFKESNQKVCNEFFTASLETPLFSEDYNKYEKKQHRSVSDSELIELSMQIFGMLNEKYCNKN